MTSRARRRWFVLAAFSLGLPLIAVRYGMREAAPREMRLSADRTELLADGFDSIHLRITGKGMARPEISVAAPRMLAVALRPSQDAWEATLRAGVNAGESQVRVRAPGFREAALTVRTILDTRDVRGDGTPDFLRLETTRDRVAFRRWFAGLAAAQAGRQADQVPAEINDCAALVRYAFREALREHTAQWAADVRLAELPGGEDVSAYRYPYTPLGAALFRVKPGPFRVADLHNGAFAEFADAKTLLRYNTHRVSRDLHHALPGDLLFYERPVALMPFHTMIWVGDGSVVYHTGPSHIERGEIRRPAVEELLRHPDADWHPVEGNPHFLGIYQWNILGRETSL